MLNNRIRWLLPAVIIVVISCLSGIPDLHLYHPSWLPPAWRACLAAHYPVYSLHIGTTGFFSYIISTDPDYVLHKIGHIGFFGLLGIALYYAMQRTGWAIAAAMGFAFLDEFHQYFVPGRSSRLGDVILDTVSAAVCVLAVCGMTRLLRKRRK